MRPTKNSFPINLMIADQLAVVVGAGKLGRHKAKLLLDAGAHVTLLDKVIKPDCDICHPNLTLIEKSFDDADIGQAKIVFACTDNRTTNKKILLAAQRHKVLCCCADGNWAKGDLITPAIIRRDDLIVSISTKGRSCRQAKLIKEKLGRHLEAIQSSELYIVGISHQELSLDQRALYQLPSPESRLALGSMIMQLAGVQEFMIVNTCNRTEIIAMAAKQVRKSAIIPRLMGLPSCYYTYTGVEAFDHLATVLAGMKAQVIGEFHIVNQIKLCAAEAIEQAWMRGALKETYELALITSRAIRNQLQSVLQVKEIETICQDFILDTLPLTEQTCLIVAGTGMIGKALINWGLEQGLHCISLYHHNALPKMANLTSLPLTSWQAILPQASIFVSAIDVAEPYFDTSASDALVIDLGAPHNIKSKRPFVDLDYLKDRYRAQAGIFTQSQTIVDEILAHNHTAFDVIQNTLR